MGGSEPQSAAADGRGEQKVAAGGGEGVQRHGGGVVRSTPSFTPHTFDPLEPFIGP